MKILVTVKAVTTVDDQFEIEGRTIPDQFCETELNEWDEYAIEEAVSIAEDDTEDVEIVAVTIGPESSEEIIREALAKGVDRAIRVWDDALAALELLDVGTKTAILAAVADREEPDLVFTGVQSADESFMATGVSLGKAIGYQWAAVVNDFELDREDGVANVRRELEGGVEELTTITLPAVVTIQTGINEPRYASLRGIRAAQQKEIAHHTLADLGLDDKNMGTLELTELSKPERESDARVLEGAPEETAVELAGVLREKGVGQ